MLHIHRADRADALLEALGALLGVPPADPFAPDLVAVPTRGIERWLTQGLATRLGILANVDFPPPRRLVDEAVARACGVDPASDPWAPERLLWAVVATVDACREEPWLSSLAKHLAASPGRLTPLRHLAGLFDRYALHRPAMIRAWAAGADVDAEGVALGARAWQAELWRRVRARIGAPGPAERLAAAIAALEAEPALSGLPPRLSVFGLTRLPPGHVDVLRALGTHREVHLLVLHPSPVLWEKTSGFLGRVPARRAEDPTALLADNRLLASWGRDVRELQLVLGEGARVAVAPGTRTGPTHLLAQLQADVRADREPAGNATLDGSVEVHACHGRARQVEVLRDALLHALQDDPTLEPRDMLVMCPDIEAFAPLIQATFGTAEPDGPLPDLRVRLADRALRQTNPVIATVGRLLELADARLTASEVLDLADRAPVRRRFAWDDDDLARLEEWTAGAGVRWGLDAPHRAPFKLDKVGAGTWRAGLDRVLLGAALTEEGERLVGGVLPFDDVESGALDLAGRFGELLDRVGTLVAACDGRRPLAAWAAVLAAAADTLTATARADAWQRAELDGLLAELVAGAAANPVELGLGELRDLLAEPLRGRPTRAGFRTGHLTFCTLNPMRSVPHRVIALLGLDDASFPRKAPWDGDDLVGETPHLGDHDGRTEDRQLLLDALMAAQDKLIVTYTGNDERTNAPRPPAVPVGELLDVIGRTANLDRALVVRRHPLQGFDPRAFGERPSFDPVALEGARALVGPREQPPALLPHPLPALVEPVLALDDLVRFTSHPMRAFLRRRLGVSVAREEEDPADALPIELDALEQWGVAERLLGAILRGSTAADARAAEDARGTLPPGELAKSVLASVGPRVRAVAAAAREELGATDGLDSLDVRLALPDGRLLHGTVAGLHDGTLQTVTSSKVGPRHRLGAWTRLLVLTLARPEREWRAVVVGRARTGARPRAEVTVVRSGPIAPELAAAQLAVLLDLHDRGLREPAPLAVKSSAAYALAAQKPLDAAARAWETARYPGEDADPEHRLLLGERAALPGAELPREDERWDPDETTRFGQWARRLWAGPLASETVEDR